MASEKGFGTPSEIIIDGRRMSSEEFEEHIVQSGVPQVDVKSFALTRINGVVKLYIATIRQEETQMKTISFKQVESALFNLDSMRTKLMNERDEAYERAYEAFADKNRELSRKLGDEVDEIQARVNEIEELLGRMRGGRVTRKEWDRIQELVAERQMQRYVTCLNSGMDERTAAGAFED